MSAHESDVTESIHPVDRAAPKGRPRVPTWVVTSLWVVCAAAFGFAVGQAAEVTMLVLGSVIALVVLLAHVELAAVTLVIASCFEDYLSTVSSASVKALAVVLVGAWAIRRVRGPLVAGRPALIIYPVAAFTSVLLLSVVLHGAGPGVAGSLSRWAGFLAVLLVLTDCLRRAEFVERLIGAYVSACALAAACGLLAYARGDVRVGGPIGDPNDFAVFLLAALPLSIAGRRAGRRTWAWDLASVTILVAVAGTLSRGAVVGLLAMLLFATVTRQISGTALAGIAGVLLALGAFTVGFFPDQVSNSLTQKSAIADQNVSERLYLWHSAEQMVLDSPLIGRGPGSFSTEHQEYVDRLPISVDHLLDVAHNTYLEVAAELGVLGLLGFLAIMVVGFRGAWQVWRRDGDPIAAGVTSAFVGVGLAAMFLSEQFYLPFWLLAALGAGRAAQPRDRRPVVIWSVEDAVPCG
ncbi:O-antigen ligase family protein [soil metagenome]